MTKATEHELVQLAKGLIGPEDLRTGGALTPQTANKIVSMIFKDAFLSKVMTVRMSRLKRNIDAFDISGRQLVRVPQGSEPTAAQTPSLSEHGCVLTALDVQLFPTLKLDFLRDNKDNPNLLQEVEAGFNTRFTHELVDLGFNGTSEGGGNFLSLNKGWVQIARESSDAINTSFKLDAGWREALQHITSRADDRYKRDSVLLMNVGDADDYAYELGGHVTGHALTAESPLRRFSGLPIEPHPYMPKGTVLFTPLKNLVFGMNTEIKRDRAYHSRKRVIEYTFDMAVDYELVIKQAAVLGELDTTDNEQQDTESDE